MNTTLSWRRYFLKSHKAHIRLPVSLVQSNNGKSTEMPTRSTSKCKEYFHIVAILSMYSCMHGRLNTTSDRKALLRLTQKKIFAKYALFIQVLLCHSLTFGVLFILWYISFSFYVFQESRPSTIWKHHVRPAYRAWKHICSAHTSSSMYKQLHFETFIDTLINQSLKAFVIHLRCNIANDSVCFMLLVLITSMHSQILLKFKDNRRIAVVQ